MISENVMINDSLGAILICPDDVVLPASKLPADHIFNLPGGGNCLDEVGVEISDWFEESLKILVVKD